MTFAESLLSPSFFYEGSFGLAPSTLLHRIIRHGPLLPARPSPPLPLPDSPGATWNAWPSVLLAVFGIGCLIIFCAKLQHSRVALSTGDHGNDNGNLAVDDVADDKRERDNEIFMGQAINEDEFKATARRSLNVQLALSINGLLVEVVTGSIKSSSPATSLVAAAGQVITWMSFVLLLTLQRCSNRSSQESFFFVDHVVHILATFMLCLQIAELVLGLDRGCWIISACSAALTSALVVVSGVTPLGPRRIYTIAQPQQDSSDETTKSASVGTEIYSFERGAHASILGRQVHSYIGPLIHASRTLQRLEPKNFGALGWTFRSERQANDFVSRFRRYVRNAQPIRLATEAFHPKASIWPLIRAVVSQNRTSLSILAAWLVLQASIRFLPDLMMNGFLNLLTDLEIGKEDNAKWAFRLTTLAPWILGRFVARYAMMTADTEMGYHSRKMYYGLLQVQFVSLLVDKSLRIKDLAGFNARRSEAAEATDKPNGSTSSDAAKADKDETSTKAQLVTLATTDVSIICNLFTWQGLSIIALPLELFFGGWLIYRILGYSALIGLSAGLVTTPISFLLGKLTAKYQAQIQDSRDRRTAILREVLSAIRMVKLEAREDFAQQRMDKMRNIELRYLEKSFIANAIMVMVFMLTPVTIGAVTFGHYVLVRGLPLTPAVAFTGLSVLEDLRWTLIAIPDSIAGLLKALVSLRRVATYLAAEEVEEVRPSTSVEDTPAGSIPPSIVLQDARVAWPVDESHGGQRASFELQDVNVTFQAGKLNLILGRIGTGKTLLLQALLREADLLEGTLLCPRSAPTAVALDDVPRPFSNTSWLCPDRVAYVPQTAFLQSTTIRKNVLFGHCFWEQRYKDTLFACGLDPDLAILEKGDETLVGQNGISLSGGQKARLTLARTVYSRAQTLLLDDVLSAVDTETAAHIITHLFQGPLAAGRTILLITHQIQALAPLADQIVVLGPNGTVGFVGDAHAFQSSEWNTELLQEAAEELEGEVEPQKSSSSASSSVPTSGTSTQTLPSPSTPLSEAQEGDVDEQKKKDQQDLEVAALTAEPSPGAVEEEKREVGQIKWKVVVDYLQAGGRTRATIIWAMALLISAFTSGWDLLYSYWIKTWTESAMEGLSWPVEDHHHSSQWWLTWFIVIGAGTGITRAARRITLGYGTLRASRELFRTLLNSVLRAPLSFHDTTPLGRLQNRFGSDFETLDTGISSGIRETLEAIFGALASLIAIVGGSSWLVIFPLAAIFLITWRVSRGYNALSRDSQRLASTAYSEVLNHISEIAAGLSVIRSFGASQHLQRELYTAMDRWASVRLMNALASLWLYRRFDLLHIILEALLSIFLVCNPYGLMTTSGYPSAALVSFLLVQMSTLHHTINALIDRIKTFEQTLVSAERILEYSTELPSEAAAIIEPRPAPDWPTRGAIIAKDLKVRYGPPTSPLVLKGLSFEVEPGEKVGIVGATGSGKTTLASSLFRLVEPASGTITIDDLDISKIGLQDLRSRMAIVPQDPVILSGTLRAAVDPFDQYSDEQVLSALRGVSLIDSTITSPSSPTTSSTDFSNLSMEIAESGASLSTGQRQLLCLARALLNKSKILVLDEATSSTDSQTQAVVQTTLTEVFKDSTIMAIAHRLRSVVGYDRVMVLGRGRLVEIDQPKRLLEKGEDSHFYRLCKATGEAEFQVLMQMAKQ